MAATTKTLRLTFLSEEKKKKSMTLANAAEDLTADEVRAAMDTIVQANVFEKDGVVLYQVPNSAEYIERTVNTLFDNDNEEQSNNSIID